MSAPRKGHRRNGYGVGKEPTYEDYGDAPGPIRGNFIPVSVPARSRSPSPKRQQQEEGVYIHLSLTDSQVDTLATAFSPQHTPEDRPGSTSKEKAAESVQRRIRAAKPAPMSRTRSRSLAKTDNPFQSPSRARSKSPVKFVGLGKSLGESRQTKFEFESTLASPIGFHLPSPTKKSEQQSSPENSAAGDSSLSLAERRNRHPLGAIDTQMAQQYMNPKSKANGPRPRAVHVPIPSPARIEVVPPRTPSPHRHIEEADDSSSHYSMRIAPTSSSLLYISPLHIGRDSDSSDHPGVLQDYNNWKKATALTAIPDAPSNEYLSAQSTEWPKIVPQRLASPLPIYSPLTPFFSTKDMPASKTASKVMIGDNGWLERTKVSPEKKPSPTKKGSFLDNLKKKAMEMVDMGELKAPRRNRDSDKERDVMRRRLKLSLNPREQSLLYCELEFVLTNALNNYITGQFNAGFLDADKLKKVADGWLQKGRPNVVGFRYDLETQLELVRLHVAKFKFYGRSIDNPGNLVGNIEMMQVNARAIRVRTFCQPDTVIAKQLLDSQGLFNILGCLEQEQIQLAEIVQFFKTVLERERYFQVKREARDSAGSGPVRPPQAEHGGQYGQHQEPLRGHSFDFGPRAE